MTEEHMLVLTPAEAASGTIKPVAIGGGLGAAAQTAMVRIPPVGDDALISVAGLVHVRIQIREPVTASRWRVAAVALLNLNGLGLGYVLTRRRLAAVLAWIATGILLLIALPVSAQGIPIAIVVLYLIVLAFTALHGAIRALREAPMWPQRSWVAIGLAVLLLAVPIGSVPLYNHAHANAVDRALLGHLAAADHTMAADAGVSFVIAQPSYVTVLATYRDLLENHRESRAGRQVPARLAAFYPAVAGGSAVGDSCGAVAPLTYLRTVPGIIPLSDLGSLATWPDDRLATALFHCGVSELTSAGGSAAADGIDDINILMSTFPASSQAVGVPPAVATAIDAAATGLAGADACTTLTNLKAFDTQVATLTSGDAGIEAALGKDRTKADQAVESGTFTCGEDQYKKGDFAAAETTMQTFKTAYPNDPNAALAGKFVIAATIAQKDAEAGKQMPTLASGGSVTITIANDSPDPVHISYTGSATGTVDITACSTCSIYWPSFGLSPLNGYCSKAAGTYPQATINVPPGTVYILDESTGTHASTPPVDVEHTSDGNTYSFCAYETRLF